MATWRANAFLRSREGGSAHAQAASVPVVGGGGVIADVLSRGICALGYGSTYEYSYPYEYDMTELD